MPTVLRVGPYSFVFFSSDAGEPVHIHVKRDRSIVADHHDVLVEAWNEQLGA